MKKTMLCLLLALALPVIAATSAPDLTVSKMTVTPAKGKVKKASLKVTVKNIGNKISAPSVTRIEAPALGQLAKKNIPALKPGESYTTSIDYVVKTAGPVQFKASADYNNAIKEINEDNNNRMVRFGFGFNL